MTILKDAEQITSGERRRDYGRPLVNHLRIAIMWSVQDSRPVSVLNVAWKMSTLKAAREINSPKYDNMLDNVGYMVCADDMARQAVELGMANDVHEGLRFLDKASVGQMFELMLLAEAADEEAKLSDFDRELQTLERLSILEDAELIKALERRGYNVQSGQQVITVTEATTVDDILDYLERSGTIINRPIPAQINKHYEGVTWQQLRSVMPSALQQDLERLSREVATVMNNERETHIKLQVVSHLSVDDMVKELNRRGIDLSPEQKTDEGWREGMPLDDIPF